MKRSSAIPSFEINPGEIHIWLFDLDLPGFDSRNREENLSEDEIDRGRGYKLERDRNRFFARRRILRQLLARYTGVHPNEIEYNSSPSGKLSLPSCKPAFNLSTSQNQLVIAFTAGEEVGIDIEKVRPMEDLKLMVNCWFSAEEKIRFSAIAAEEQLEAFYQIWTQKEAYLKARGIGLTDGMMDFSVSVDPRKLGEKYKIQGDDGTIWQMICEVPEPGWRLAVCMQMEKEPVITYLSEGADEVLLAD